MGEQTATSNHDESVLREQDRGRNPWWFKCDEPERPGDIFCVYVWDCDACVVGLIAEAAANPDMSSRNVRDGGEERPSTLAATRDEVLAWREQEGLRLFSREAS